MASSHNNAARRGPQPVLYAGTSGSELSVVIPCLNEADTLAVCVRKALAAR